MIDHDGLLARYREDVQRRGARAAYDALLQAVLDGHASGDDWEAIALGMLKQGMPGAVVALAEEGLARHPNLVGLRYHLGNALRMIGERQAAERELRAVLAVQPAHAGALASLANLLRGEGRLQAAAQVALEGMPVLPDLARIRETLVFLRECEAVRPALELAQAALRDAPEDAELHGVAGELAAELGRFEQARVHLRRAVALQPEFASGCLRLAGVHAFRSGDEPDAKAIELAARSLPIEGDAGLAARFAWAKVLADLGDLAGAAQQLRKSNAAMRLRMQWSASGFDAFINRQIGIPPPTPVAKRLEFTPVLIVGLPRTGTTLVASLLERHPQVRSRGELNWLSELALHVETGARAPAKLTEAAAFYVAQLRRDDAPARVIIDKNPLNFRHLGMASALLPGVRVIHCRRDARDTALSIFRQMFAHRDNGYAYAFEDIVAFSRGEARLMEHWRGTLSVPMIDVDYERLVRDTDGVLAELLQFLGLGSASLSAKSATPIRTASVWQARQPVHARAVDAWKAWAPHLPELANVIPEQRP